MKYLLDTHVFIWAMEDNKRLQQEIKDTISSSKNKVFVSVSTIWEITIKKSLKKLKTPFDIEASIEKTGLQVIPIQITHALKIEKLPLHHKDPFDRILIAQAKVENLTLITADQKIWQYKLSLIKA